MKPRPSREIMVVLDGVYRRTGGEPVFQEVCAPSRDELAGLLDKIIARLMKLLARQGTLVEEQGMTYLADMDADNPLASLQAAAWPCRPRRASGPAPRQAQTVHRTVCAWARLAAPGRGQARGAAPGPATPSA